MKAIRFVLPILLLAGCASRQTTQTTSQPGSQPPGSQPPGSQPSEQAQAAPPAAQPVEAVPQREAPVSIPAGAVFSVRLEGALDTARNRAGDHFFATLVNPIEVQGTTVLPKGTRFSGHLVESKPSGRLKGRAILSLSLDSFDLGGRRYDISTSRLARASGGHKKRNWILIGGGSGVGAAFGAIAGAPAALIGAGAGAAAGATGAAFTGRKNVSLPVETRLAFTLRSPVRIGDQNVAMRSEVF